MLASALGDSMGTRNLGERSETHKPVSDIQDSPRTTRLQPMRAENSAGPAFFGALKVSPEQAY